MRQKYVSLYRIVWSRNKIEKVSMPSAVKSSKSQKAYMLIKFAYLKREKKIASSIFKNLECKIWLICKFSEKNWSETINFNRSDSPLLRPHLHTDKMIFLGGRGQFALVRLGQKKANIRIPKFILPLLTRNGIFRGS